MAHDTDDSEDATAKREALLRYQKQSLAYVADWLRHRNLKQKHIANALGVAEGTVSRYLGGETLMSVGHLRKIAVLLKCEPGDLLRPPPAEGLGELVEETLAEMDRIGPERWRRLLAGAKDLKGKQDS